MVKQCDVLVIGGGPGGTPAAMALSSMGKHVILVEAGKGLGGTCLFEGCIPSKIIRESARRVRDIRSANEFGLSLPSLEVSTNWSQIMQRKARILQQRSQGALHKAAQIENLELLFGHASFTNEHEVELLQADGTKLTISFKKAIIATGSKPNLPPIKGIDHPHVLDSQAILSIDHIPKQLLIIGGGPIGVELGQMFNTLGSKVTLLEMAPQILGTIDVDLAKRLEQRMTQEGIQVKTEVSDISLDHQDNEVTINYTNNEGEHCSETAEYVLQVTGRIPNIDKLGLENTHIEFDRHGVKVNESLQTSVEHIYAAGDVVGQPMFAHWATSQCLAIAQHIMGKNIPFPPVDVNTAVIFSEPEIGMAGIIEKQAKQKNIDYGVASYDFAQDARAQIMGEAEGLLKIIFDKQSRKVIGVHVMIEGAGELMGEAALLVRAGLPVELIAGAIHPHPTLTESFAFAVRNALANQK